MKYIGDSWAGRVPSSITVHRQIGDTVLNFRVDEMAEYVFKTSPSGGIDITDLYTAEMLWSLPSRYFPPQSYYTYRDGYLVLGIYRPPAHLGDLAVFQRLQRRRAPLVCCTSVSTDSKPTRGIPRGRREAQFIIARSFSSLGSSPTTPVSSHTPLFDNFNVVLVRRVG